tara:strand:- start:166 stop:498 length:333 start_codon:yes stop_codon:yes gene_type:complete
MSNFFDSEIVKEELQEIRDLQNEIYGKIPTLNMFSHDEKVDHIEKLETLLEKQRLMFTRLSLSDDSEAIKMKNHMQETVSLMGFPEGTDMSLLFSFMQETIDNLRKEVDQ